MKNDLLMKINSFVHQCWVTLERLPMSEQKADDAFCLPPLHKIHSCVPF